jgi:hypothetical protein
MSVEKEISGLVKGEHALGALYLGLLVATVADLIPHPMDAVYFNLQKKNRDKFISGEITPKQYWRRNVIAYYGCDALWWGFLLLVAVSVGGKAKDKLVVVGTILGAGAVVGIIHQNIRKDEEEQELKKQIKTNIEDFKNKQ